MLQCPPASHTGQLRVEESKESGLSAHRSMCLLCALEAEGGTTFAADVHWLAPHICFSLYGVLTPCSRQAVLMLCLFAGCAA